VIYYQEAFETVEISHLALSMSSLSPLNQNHSNICESSKAFKDNASQLFHSSTTVFFVTKHDNMAALDCQAFVKQRQ
jgi:hypothetical protein